MKACAIRNILCPIDLGDSSSLVLTWAGLFSRTCEANLEIFHAQWLEAPAFFTHSQIESLRSEMRTQEQKVREFVVQLAGKVLLPGTSFQERVVEGHAVSAIEERLKGGDIDLIVMGSHGRSATSRFLLGSVSENVVRIAKCPVLIARPGNPDHPLRIRRLLCPSDFSDGAAQTLDVCATIAARFDAEVTVLHAVQEASQVAAATSRLCDWVSGGTRKLCRVKEVVREGNAAELIISTIEAEGADLVVLGAEHKPFLQLTTIGTTTEKVMRHSPVSVLVTPLGN